MDARDSARALWILTYRAVVYILDLNLKWNYFTNEAFALLAANLVASLTVEYQTFV